MSGGVAGAEAGTLTIMAGGEEALLDRARPLLDGLGAEIVHVGDRPGDGDAAKTINNMLSATNLAAAAEALSLGVRAGLDPERLMSCVNGGTGASNASQNKVAGQVLTGRFASRFTIGQYLKDLRIALGLAADHDVPAPVNSTACSVWTSHAARGAAGDDHTRLVDLVLRDAGLEMRWGETYPNRLTGGCVTNPEAQQYLDDMVRARGYVLDYHKRLVGADYEFARAANEIVDAAYLRERRLDRKVKELIFIVSLTAMRATRAHPEPHPRRPRPRLLAGGDPRGDRDRAARGRDRRVPGGLRGVGRGGRGSGARAKRGRRR